MTNTDSSPSLSTAPPAPHGSSATRIWLVALGLVAVVYAAPISPYAWVWAAAALAAAALPDGRLAGTVRKVVLATAVVAVLLAVLAVAFLFLCFAAMGGQIG